MVPDSRSMHGFIAVEVTAILHGCRTCGQPVPINGLVGETTCPHCSSSVAVPLDLWKRALGALDVGTLVDSGSGKPLQRSTETKDSASDHKLVMERHVRPVPHCLACGEALAGSGARFLAAEVDLTCPACGARTRFEPPGLDLDLGSVILTHVAAPEGGSPPPHATRACSSEGIRPIAMACPSCAAGLQITADDQRTTTCSYCDASVYIPDDLWRQLHPVKRATSWNLVFRLTPAALRRAGTSKVGCMLGAIVLCGGGLIGGLSAGTVGAYEEGQLFPALVCGTLLMIVGAIALALLGSSVASALRYRKIAKLVEQTEEDSASSGETTS